MTNGCARFLASLVGSVLLSGPVAAQVAPPQGQTDEKTGQTGGETRKTVDWLDLSASLGFSANPNSQYSSSSSIFGRVSASGTHQWNSETGSTSIHGYVENTTYVSGGYGSRQNFIVGATTSQQVSETVGLYGNATFSGDYAGQLSNRLTSYPTQPPPIDPSNPLPPPQDYPDLYGLSGRQYRASGNVGASIRTGARGTVSLAAGLQHSWFPGQSSDANYTSYFGSAGYSSLVSERTHVGVNVGVARQDFTGGDWSNSINPAVTLDTRFSESLHAAASVGVIALKERTQEGNDSSVSPSFSGSLCNETTVSRLCGKISRNAQTGLSSGILSGQRVSSIATDASVAYFHRLGPEGTIQASLSATHYDSPSSVDGESFKSTYFSGVLGYDRHIGNRVYAGVQGGARKLFQSGPDPKVDFNASVYVRYRIGDLL